MSANPDSWGSIQRYNRLRGVALGFGAADFALAVGDIPLLIASWKHLTLLRLQGPGPVEISGPPLQLRVALSLLPLLGGGAILLGAVARRWRLVRLGLLTTTTGWALCSLDFGVGMQWWLSESRPVWRHPDCWVLLVPPIATLANGLALALLGPRYRTMEMATTMGAHPS